MTTRQAGRLGRLPNDPSKPRLHLRFYRLSTALPPPPVSENWYGKVITWPMYLNDQLGDCTIAEVGHQVESASAYTGSAEITVTNPQIQAMYTRVGGYVPGDPSTDNGCVIQDVLGDWRKNGLAGHKCLAFAEVDISNLTEVKAAVAAFGALDLGHSVYQGDMDAFNNGTDWSATYSKGQLLGGHSTELVGYDADGGWLVTWGHVQRFTWAWWKARMEEAWLAVLPEWLNAAGESPSGYDLYGLGQEMSALTGDPNPFPAPAPGPAPVPVPPADADQALWAVAGPWAHETRTRPDLVRLKAALQEWAASKAIA